ncbi:FAD-dependent thymidylate synthase [Streptacidiphilus sp. N1-12]|uniref:FAD-dependent thymidylate synthase n=2 Tax=Streptacidiphilus alkalitolerans TaxID=3342712 RepID=A0ABV6VC29_9ACTN
MTSENTTTLPARGIPADPDAPVLELRSDISVDLVDHSASDLSVVRAARVSTVGDDAQYETKGDGYVAGLIDYLMKSRHGSPFEHNYLTFLITAPIFTVRHLMRHRTWSFNEESARYRELRPVFYVPDADRLLRQEGKPGHYTYVAGDGDDHQLVTEASAAVYAKAYQEYTGMLQAGIAREIARMVLPVATYSSVYATCNSRALMHFLSLRTARPDATYPSHPQREIEIVAEQMENSLQKLMPLTHAAYEAHGRVSP